MTDTTRTSTPTGGGGTTAPEAAKQHAADVAATGQEKADELLDEARNHAQELVDETRRTARARAEEQGNRLADTARNTAGDLRSMADAGEGQLSGLVEQGADYLQRFADRLDHGGLDAVLDDARRQARRRPLAFLASTVAAGFVTGRLLRNADTEQMTDAVRSEIDDGAALRADPPLATTRPLEGT